MQRTISDFVNYKSDPNTKRLRKFLKIIERNMNNSVNIDNTIDPNRNSKGYILQIERISGIKKVGTSKQQDEESVVNKNNEESEFKYYIVFYVNLFNNTKNKYFGNTFCTQKIPVLFDDTFTIQLDTNDFIHCYFLCNEIEEEDMQCIVQICLLKSTKDDVIINQKLKGWTIFPLKLAVVDDPSKYTINEVPLNEEQIYLGSPRELEYCNREHLDKREGAALKYRILNYPNLSKIKFLLPDFTILGNNLRLPGLLKSLPQSSKDFDINEEIKNLNFDEVYLKDIIIDISQSLEEKIIGFSEVYRKSKYKNLSQLRKVFIKERRLKCGFHNSWCFINSNGLENGLTLSLEGNSKLIYKGAFMVNNFFNDEFLCQCAFILELNYTVAIPCEENRIEDIYLPIAYTVLVPNLIDNDDKEYSSCFITGPGITVYGDHLWNCDTLEPNDRKIKISFKLSKNKELLFKLPKENEERKTNEEIKEKSMIDAMNKKELENKELQEIIKKLQQDQINLLNQKPQIIYKEKPQEQPQIIQNIQPPPVQPQVEIKPQPQPQPEIYKDVQKIEERNTTTNITVIQQGQMKMTQEEYEEFKLFQDFKNRNDMYKSYQSMDQIINDNREKSKLIYEQRVKDISRRDRANFMSKGILSLNLLEKDNSIIEFTLNKELENKNLGYLINFQFLSYKPNKNCKNFDNLPQRIKFIFDFFNNQNLSSPNCKILKPESNIKNNANDPRILIKESAEYTSIESEKEVSVQIKYDPSIETSIDYKLFITYLLTKNLVIEVFDIERNFSLGYIKLPLRDLIRQGKPSIYQAKEYEIYNNNFILNGYIQILLRSEELMTAKPFVYNPYNFKLIYSKDGYNNQSRKKKVRVKPIDTSNINNEEKEKIGQLLIMKNQFNESNINNDYNNRYKKMSLDPEIEKKVRVMRYFNTKNTVKSNINNRNNNNQFNSQMESKFAELKSKRDDDEKFYKNLSYVENYREVRRKDVISKVTQENHKNEFNISLIQGQPYYFNYIIDNDSQNSQLLRISVTSDNDFNNNQNDVIVSIINSPQEWADVVIKNDLKQPSSYESITYENCLTVGALESIPIVIKLLSFNTYKDFNKKYNIMVHRQNGEPLYFLCITIVSVFPIIDHVFRYYLPCNSVQEVDLVNPFKDSTRKTAKFLRNLISSDKNINLILVNDNFTFQYTTKEEGFVHEFYFYLYNEDDTKSKLYSTWKFVILCMNVINVDTSLGSKQNLKLNISNNRDNNNEGKTLQLFSQNYNYLYFPEESNNSFILQTNETVECSYIVYPKLEYKSDIIINCVNVSNRELFRTWLVKINCSKPKIDETQKVDCFIGSITNIKYQFTNPLNKWCLLNFDTSDEEFLNVVEQKISFNSNETKYINLSIPSQNKVGIEEVMLFVYDNEEYFSKIILFQLNFKNY